MIIATDCLDHDLLLIESDKHFAKISGHLPLKRGRLPVIPQR